MEKGFIKTSQSNTVRSGMSREEVRELLGEPAEVYSSNEITTPSEAFESIGSMFRAGDENLEEVWAYKNKVRVRLTYLYGFRGGKLVVSWHETISQARAEELAKFNKTGC